MSVERLLVADGWDVVGATGGVVEGETSLDPSGTCATSGGGTW